MRRLLSAIAMAAVFTAACGKSEEQKQAEKAADEIKKAAEAVGQAAAKTGQAVGTEAATDMAKAMSGMAAALGGAANDGTPVDPISFQTLQTHLPTVSGWKMDEPKGQRMTAPVPFSQVETDYRNGGTRINVKIVDTGFAQVLVAPWSMMVASGYSRETSRGYEKVTTVAGHPAVEKWNKDLKNGELDVLVGKRFMVTIEGHDLSDMKQVTDLASNFKFDAIAAAK